MHLRTVRKTAGDFPYDISISRKFPIIAVTDKIISLGQMLRLLTRVATVKVDREAIGIRRDIERVDRQIDRLIYEVYELTERKPRGRRGDLRFGTTTVRRTFRRDFCEIY